MDINFMNVLLALLVLGILGLIFGLILAVASKIFEVKTDPRFPLIMDCLPGANCGGCGYAGCSAAANAIIEGKASVSCCPVGGAEAAEQIAAIMGVEAAAGEREIAHVICNGGNACFIAVNSQDLVAERAERLGYAFPKAANPDYGK